MATQNLSENVLLITLPAEPQLSHDLEITARSIHPAFERDVIVDFTLVESLPSATICHLIVLERVLSAAGRQLVLCSVSPTVLALFRRIGLSKLFQFTGEELAAMQLLGCDRHVCP